MWFAADRNTRNKDAAHRMFLPKALESWVAETWVAEGGITKGQLRLARKA